MKVLQEISRLSKTKPMSGLKGELFRLIQEKGYSRDQAIAHFAKQGKEGHFRVVYKNLKDDLLDGLLQANFSGVSKVLSTRFKIWKKELQTKILLQTGNVNAGVKLAIETITLAEKNDQLKTIESLCLLLTKHYVIVAPDNLQYLKYNEKLTKVRRQVSDEIGAEMVYYDLIFCYRSKRDFSHILSDINRLDELAKTNTHFKFRFFWYSIKNIYYQLIHSENELIKNNKAALSFFENYDGPLPYSTKYIFLADLIPIYILKGQFFEAGYTINKAIALPLVGSFNWHRVLLFKSQLGFYSEKPKVSVEAFKMSQSVKKRFDSDLISERWHLIEGYLSLYDSSRKFKLSKWLNIKEKKGNPNQKANLIIVELLHYLFHKDYPSFLKRTELIESQISTHFKGHSFKRTRYFLRMIRVVLKGHYKASLVSAHAAKNLARLEASGGGLDVEMMDREVVRYEVLWDMVLSELK